MSDETRTYHICFVPGYWGLGDTPEDAEHACHKAGGRFGKRLIISVIQNAADPAPYVDRYGDLIHCGGVLIQSFRTTRYKKPVKKKDT